MVLTPGADQAFRVSVPRRLPRRGRLAAGDPRTPRPGSAATVRRTPRAAPGRRLRAVGRAALAGAGDQAEAAARHREEGLSVVGRGPVVVTRRSGSPG